MGDLIDISILGNYYIIILLYFFLVTSFLAITVYAFRRKWAVINDARRLAVNISVMVFTTLYILVILEIVFCYIYTPSDSWNFTLSSKRWFQKYWKPVNSYGYRDYEPEWRDKVLFVVGDSFVAGHGVKDIDERFSNALSQKMEEDWTVTILAKCAWNIQDYIEILRKQNRRPDVIIISYVFNDIKNHPSVQKTMAKKHTIRLPGGVAKVMVNNSYFLNWAYWKIRKQGHVEKYTTFLKRSYDNDRIWSDHTSNLDTIINYAGETGAKLKFVV